MPAPVLAAEPATALIAVAALFVVGIAWIVSSVRNDKRRQIWAETAERLGISVIGQDHLLGDLDGSAVEVDLVTRGSGKNRRTYTRIRASGHLPDGVSFAREGFFSFGDDVRTGDGTFDGEVKVKGDETLALALLDEPMRWSVRAAVRGDWVFNDGVWTYEVQRRITTDLEEIVRRGAELAKEVRAAGRAVAPRLAERVAKEENAGVRLRCLQALIERYHVSISLDAALGNAIEDRDPPIRYTAATYKRDVAVLATLARDRSNAPQLRADALGEASREPGHAAAKQTVEALLVELAEGEMSPVVSRGLARALGTVPSERAEATLIEFLSSENEPLRLQAMRSLGHVGTVAAVPALIPHRDRFFAFAMESAAIAKDAILQIQSRAGRSEAGALALAEGVEGSLALTEEHGAQKAETQHEWEET